MVVSMIQFIIELPEASTLKDKRQIVRSVRDRFQKKFRMSAAEVDLHDSVSFAQIGGAIVSNSKTFGEAVLNKAFALVESELPVRIHDVSIYSEEF
jgi:uncharacterized protein YlxP (DUF503 family)